MFDLRITPDTKIATAGSCFAQHIARHLRNSGFNHFVVEPGHPIISASVRAKNNYGLFSARYGNIYTSRQLLQLFQRAFGEFTPLEDVWQEEVDVFLDPFRPSIQPEDPFLPKSFALTGSNISHWCARCSRRSTSSSSL